MIGRIVLLLSLIWLNIACTQAAQPEQAPSLLSHEPTTLTVFAAISLTDAFTRIGQEFAASNPGVQVIFNFGGSQQLAQQLGQGAGADIFAAAHQKQMESVIAAGRVVSGTAQIFACNRLVVIIPQESPGQITQLADLAKADLKLVLADQAVPVGQYSLDFLDKAAADGTLGRAYKTAVLNNVVSYEENVKAVLTKVRLGEADAGIIYVSDLVGVTDVGQIAIPDTLNIIASYPMAVIQDSPHSALAQKLVDYILSPAGQQVLEQAGFIGVK